MNTITLHPIGVVRSGLTIRKDAPRQGHEGAPDAWVDIDSAYLPGLEGIVAGAEVILLTWLHEAQREVLMVRPRHDPANPLTGVFATRSPDRPNPIGLHRVTIREIDANHLQVGPLEAIDGTLVLDIKPVLASLADAS